MCACIYMLSYIVKSLTRSRLRGSLISSFAVVEGVCWKVTEMLVSKRSQEVVNDFSKILLTSLKRLRDVLMLVPTTVQDLAWVVRKGDNAIHRINHYPGDSVVCFVNTYPLDSDLSGG